MANVLAFPHFAICVGDLDAGFAEIMFCTGPEGTRIELVQMKGDWPGYATQGE